MCSNVLNSLLSVLQAQAPRDIWQNEGDGIDEDLDDEDDLRFAISLAQLSHKL